jgi:predicted MFS family arabinose efflux permease
MVERQATYRQAFAVAPYRVLLASRTLAIGAGALRIVALSVLVYTQTASPMLSAVTFAIGFLPQAVGGMLFASLADRWSPRLTIGAGLLLECLVALVLAVGHPPIFGMLALLAFAGVLTPVFNGTAGRVIADVLTGDTYVLGRSLSNIASGAAQLVGMAFGGLAVAAIGTRQAIAVSAGCLLVSALIVLTGLTGLSPVSARARRSVLIQSWTTNKLLLADREVRQLLLIQWLPPAFVVGAGASVVAYAAERGFTTAVAGLLLACAPGGMLVGDLIVGRFVRPDIRTRLVAPLIAVLGVPLILLAVNPPLPLVAASLAISASGFAFMLGLQQRFLEIVPARHRGQAFTVQSTGLMTLQGVGPVVIGAIGQVTSVSVAMAAAGVAALACALAWAGTRSARRIPP